MTIIYPEAVSAYGTQSVIVAQTLADPNAPKVSELTAATALNISCFLYDGGAVTGEQNKGDAPPRICDTSTREKLGTVKYTIADLQYMYAPQGDPDSDGNKAKTALAPGTEVYIIERLGMLSKTEPLAAGQVVNVYPVTLGVQNRTKQGDGEFSEWSITQGASLRSDPIYDVKLAA